MQVLEYEYKKLRHECIYHMKLREASDRDLVNFYKSSQKLNEDCEKLQGQLKELKEAALPIEGYWCHTWAGQRLLHWSKPGHNKTASAKLQQRRGSPRWERRRAPGQHLEGSHIRQGEQGDDKKDSGKMVRIDEAWRSAAVRHGSGSQNSHASTAENSRGVAARFSGGGRFGTCTHLHASAVAELVHSHAYVQARGMDVPGGDTTRRSVARLVSGRGPACTCWGSRWRHGR
jgi:hypothetical protein